MEGLGCMLFHRISLLGGDVPSATEGTLQLKECDTFLTKECDTFLTWKQFDGMVVESIEKKDVERMWWKQTSQLPKRFKVVVVEKRRGGEEARVLEFSGFNHTKHAKFLEQLDEWHNLICQEEELVQPEPDAEGK